MNLLKHCKAIEGFPYYCIHPDGIVYSCRGRGGIMRDWTPMKPAWLHRGTVKARLFVLLRGDDVKKGKTIHRLVLEAFKGPCPVGQEGCHNDGDPSNNRVGNLRWDTHKRNMADRVAHGTHPVGSKNPAAKLNEKQVQEIRRLNRNGMFQKEIAPLFSVSKQCIQAVCSGSTWSSVK